MRATNWVGDAVMALPGLRALRRRFPDSQICLLAMPGIAGLYARETWVSEVILLEGARGARDWSRKWRQARDLARRRFDLALLFTNSFESAALFAAARIPWRAGYARDGRTLLLTQAVPPPRRGEIPRHESYYYLELLKRAGLLPEGCWPPEDEMVIRLEGIEAAQAAGRARLDAEFDAGQPVIGVSPGAAYGTAKRWLPERFAEAARLLAGRHGGAGVAVFGTPDEQELCEQVAAAAGGKSFAGQTRLAEFIDMAAACTAFLTNDSGSMHIASALGLPTVAVFGATDHVGTGPTGPLARVVRHAVDCSPYPHPCLKRFCPIDHRCMKAVSAAEVADEAGKLVEVRRRAGEIRDNS